MKAFIALCLLPLISFSQIQLGGNMVGEVSGDRSGWSVSTSADGTVVAAGAYLNDDNGSTSGHVRIFKIIDGDWVQLGEAIAGDSNGDQSGFSVSLSANGEIVAIGAPRKRLNGGSNAGHVRVFGFNSSANSWEQLGGDLDNGERGDRFGFSVSLSDDGYTLAVGAPTFDPGGLSGGLLSAGQVKIYKYESDNWMQEGQTLLGEDPFDELGHSLSISGDGSRVALGAGGSGAGNGNKVKIYENVNGTWEKQGNTILPEASNEELGYTISLSNDGSTVALGLSYNEDGFNLGKTRVYQQDNNMWNKKGEDIELDVFPGSVSLSATGHILAVGIPSRNVAKVYEYTANNWNPLGNDIEAENAGDSTGRSVSLSDDGSKLAVGSPLFNQSGNDKGLVRVFDFNAEPEPTEAFLLVEILGEGSISPEYDSETAFEVGEEITVEAIPAEGYVFDKFVIDGEEFMTNPIAIQMDTTINLAVVFEVGPTLSNDAVQLKNLSVYPNPFRSSVYLSKVSQPLSFEIFSSDGLRLQKGKVENQMLQLDQLKSGLYILKLKGKDHQKIVKLLKQ